MATRTANTGSNNWNTNACWVGGVQPTAADDVIIPNAASVTIPAATTVQGRGLTVQSGATLIGALTTSILNLGDGTAGAGNVALSINAGATITNTGTWNINFISTSATQQTMATGGKVLPTITINGVGSSYVLTSSLTQSAAGIFNLTNGTFDSGSFAMSMSAFTINTGTKTLTLGSSAISLSATGVAFSIGVATGFTMSANTAVVTVTGAAVNANTLILANVNWNGLSFVFSGGGTPNVNQNGATINNLTFTGRNVKTDQLGLNGTPVGNLTINGTLTVNGNSVVNRVLLSVTLARGTSVSIITPNTPVFSNVDFMDIGAAGASAPWNLSAIAGGSGDCQGNSGITFTTAINQTYSGGTGTWSTMAWPTRVPLPQDNSTITGTGTITYDMPRLGRDLNFTGFSGTYTGGVNWEIYGSYILSTGMTYGPIASGGFGGRGSHTITTNGKSPGGTTSTFNGPGGTYTLQDTFTSSGIIALNSGGIDTNNQTVNSLTFSAGTTIPSTLTLGTTIWTLSQTATTTIWNVTNTMLTLSALSSTIVVGVASANTRVFAGGSYAYGALNYTVASSTGRLTINGSNGFENLSISGGTRDLALQTNTINTVTNFNVFGTAGNLINVVTTTAGTRATINRSRGAPISVDYLAVQDVIYTVPYGMYVGANSVNNGNNLGVVFTVPVIAPYIYEVDSPGQVTGASNTVNFSAPQAGALLTYAISIQNSFGTITGPSGWTLAINRSQATNTHMYAWYKVSDGTETSVTSSWTTSRPNTGIVYQVRGFTGVPTLDGTDSNGSASATSLSTGTGVSNTGVPGIAVAYVGGNGGIGASTATPTNGFGEDYTLGIGSASVSMKAAALPLTSIGSQSTTFSWSTSRVPVALLMQFRDVAAAGGGLRITYKPPYFS